MRWFHLALFVSACSSCPPPPPAQPRAQEVPAHAAEPPSLDGRWVVSVLGDARVQGEIAIQGSEGTFGRSDTEGVALSVRERTERGALLELRVPAGASELRWESISDDRAVLSAGSDAPLLVARRVGPVPGDLQGEWLVSTPDGEHLRRLHVGAREVQLITPDGETRTMALRGLGEEGPAATALRIDSPEASAPGVMVVQRIGPDEYATVPLDEPQGYEVWRRPR